MGFDTQRGRIMGGPTIVFPAPGAGEIKWLRDATLNDSDKTWTVPAGHVWELLDIEVAITCTATVGNRSLRFYITDGSDNIVYASRATGNIAASQLGALKLYPGAAYSTTTAAYVALTGAAANIVTVDPLPNVLVPAGYKIRIFDAGSIDAAADDMVVVMHYKDYALKQ